LEPTFFGFSPADRATLHENLWDLLWWGEGRWDWNTLYNLHVPLRTFWFRKMNNILQMRQDAAEKASKNNHSKPVRNEPVKGPF
jgi:hypothetical protein